MLADFFQPHRNQDSPIVVPSKFGRRGASLGSEFDGVGVDPWIAYLFSDVMEIAWKEAVTAMPNSETLEKVLLSLAVSGTGLLGTYFMWRALRDLAAERQGCKRSQIVETGQAVDH